MADIGSLASKIAQLRRSQGLTQEEVGNRVGVSAQAVSKWENGDSLPDLTLITELAELFHSSTDYLLGREGGLETLLPQIFLAIASMKVEEKVSFVSKIINMVHEPRSPISDQQEGHPSLVHIHLGPTGFGLWAKDRLACIATTNFLDEAKETFREESEFPINLLPDDIRSVLLALLRNMDDLKPDYAIDEETIRAQLVHLEDLDRTLMHSIDLGFVDRVRGGYRLNYKGDLVVRLLSIIHHTINKQGTMNVTVGRQ